MLEIGRLREAVGTGEIVRVRYHGGSAPGAVREVQVLAVDSGYLSALCLATSTFKTFRLERLDLCSDDEPVTYSPGKSGRFRVLSDLEPVILPLIEAPDVHVVCTHRSIAVHRLRKNDGKPFVNPSHELAVIEGDRTPWVVRNKTARTFRTLDQAAAAFLRGMGHTPPWNAAPARKAKLRGPDFSVLGREIHEPLHLDLPVSDEVPAPNPVNAAPHAPEASPADAAPPRPGGVLARLLKWIRG